MGTRKRQFLFIFIFTFLYKLSFAWRSGIKAGWQDELSWNALAQRETFFGTITQFDSGYPTPLLRAFSFALAHTTVDSFLIWHIFILLVISGCLASLAYSRIIDSRSGYLVAGLACSYPSFDLLLLHNLSYWTFIPLFVILLNILYGKGEMHATQFISLLGLIVFTAKPQLLSLVFTLIISIGITRNQYRAPLFMVALTIIFLFFLGRFSKNSVNLAFDLPSIFNFGFTLNSHLLNIIALLLVVSLYKISKIFNQPMLVGVYYIITSFAFTKLLYKFLRHKSQDVRTLAVIFSLLFYTSSLYIFPNSGWSNNNLLSSYDFISLYSRHYLPIIFIGSFLLIRLFKNRRFLNAVLALGMLQNIVIQIALFNQFYRPI